jgi:hypothetical protein
VAVNCKVVPAWNDGFDGEIVMEVSVALLMCRLVEAVGPLDAVAVMVLLPPATAVARPVEALMVAAAVLEEDQATVEVTSCVVPSLNVAVAWNCKVLPMTTVGFDGATVSD